MAAAADSGEANSTFSQAVSTVSPARSSMQDIAGVAAIAGGACTDEADGPPGQPKPRMVAVTATPTASSVMTVSAPLATDFSARTIVISIRIAKNPAAASVSHIGNDGERQM